jgi:hypothetical protein
VLTTALVSAVILVAVLTALLIVVGRRPTSYRARAVGLAPLVLAPLVPFETTLVVLVVGLLCFGLPRYWYAIGAWFFGALVLSFSLYAIYLVQATLLLGGEPASLIVGLLLLVIQVAAMALLSASAFEMVDALCGPPVAPVLPAEPPRWPVVCLQVPTYNEPPDLVIETIRSLVALDYPALRVHVIDNNTSDEALWRPVEAECRRLREEGHVVQFDHLPVWPGYKGGALNWGLASTEPDVEIIGVVDADYVVQPDWLTSTIPHFSDPRVAFVQTPQDYRAWEHSAFYRACYVGFAYFFKVGMVSRARRNGIIFAGTMGLIRRSVLDDVGGWDEAIITEDAEISLRVLARGHRCVYVPVAYGRGIMPLTYEGLRKQRFRWAFGGIQILRRHRPTLLGRQSGLTVGQRYDHFMGGLWWFNDALTFAFALFVAAAAIGVIAGRPFMVQRLTGLGLVLPLVFILLNLVRYVWALGATTGARPPLALAALRVNLSLSWVIALACIRGLTQERGVFLRTPKFQGAAAVRELRLVWVETSLAAAAIGLLVLVGLTAGFSTAGLTLTGLMAWTALIYGSSTSYALGDPARAPISRALAEKARLEVLPRVGRVARSRPARAGVGALALSFIAVAFIALESGRPPVSQLPFVEVPEGPVARPAPVVQPIAERTPPPGSERTEAPDAASPPAPPPTAGPDPRSTPATGPAPSPSPFPSPASSAVPGLPEPEPSAPPGTPGFPGSTPAAPPGLPDPSPGAPASPSLPVSTSAPGPPVPLPPAVPTAQPTPPRAPPVP